MKKQVSGYIFVFNLLDELLCILILYFYFYKFYFLTEPRVSAEWFQRPKILWILRRIFKKKQYIFKNVLRTNTLSLVTNVVREEVPKTAYNINLLYFRTRSLLSASGSLFSHILSRPINTCPISNTNMFGRLLMH